MAACAAFPLTVTRSAENPLQADSPGRSLPHLHHVHMSCQNNVRMVKFSKTDQFAFSGCRKADSLFTKPCTFICINVFFRRNGKKRYGPDGEAEPPSLVSANAAPIMAAICAWCPHACAVPLTGSAIGCDLHPMASSSPIIVMFGTSCSSTQREPLCVQVLHAHEVPGHAKKPLRVRLFSPHKIPAPDGSGYPSQRL